MKCCCIVSLSLSLSDLLLLFEHLTYKQKVNLFECTDLRNCVVKIEMSPDYRICQLGGRIPVVVTLSRFHGHHPVDLLFVNSRCSLVMCWALIFFSFFNFLFNSIPLQVSYSGTSQFLASHIWRLDSNILVSQKKKKGQQHTCLMSKITSFMFIIEPVNVCIQEVERTLKNHLEIILFLNVISEIQQNGKMY